MNKKLLHKTSTLYLIFITILVFFSAPVFYFTIQNLYSEDVDEALELRKEEFLKYSVNQLNQIDVPVWNTFNRDIKIIENQHIKKDTFFIKMYYDSLNAENEPYRELNAPVVIEGKPYTLSFRANMVESEDLIMSIFVFFTLLISLLLLGLFYINKKLTANLWKPFYQTLQQIESFEIDKNLKPNLPDTNIEEFYSLNQSIENLIERNIVIYNNQREFVENAAHELQTPIAVFKAKIDDLMQRTDITKGQSEVLTALNDSISKLNRLNKNLLLLSKIDKQTYREIETFYIKELIEKNLVFFTEQATLKTITLITDFQSDFVLNANKGLTAIMLNNLLMNAISHNIQHGMVDISLGNKTLSISNTGKNTELSSDKLFRRFSKANPSDKGNGLGLAIVKKIADLYHWQIDYSFYENKHTFSVFFH
jgi:signal transduction histidine kinase